MRSFLFLAYAFASLLVAGPAFADSSSLTAPASLVEFHQVTPSIYRGSRPYTEADFQFLAAMGIKCIINLQGGDYSDNEFIGAIVPYFEAGEKPEEIAAEKASAARYGIEMISLPLNSLKPITFAESKMIEEALRIMQNANEGGGPVYVHCAHGKDRTGLVVALYRIKYQGWTATAAYEEMRQMGHSTFNMIATWPLDFYFFKYAGWLALKKAFGEPEITAASCEAALAHLGFLN